LVDPRIRAVVSGVGTAETGCERELVARVQGGDTEAFDALVAQYVRRARAIAYRLMRNPEDADDLVQDAFLRALQRIDEFDPARPFGPWFFRLLVNTGLDTLRRLKLRNTEPEPMDTPDPAPRPDQHLDRTEIRSRFEEALAALPARQRLVVWAHEVDGMDTREIAETTGTSQATVRWHLHAGRKALRAALADVRR
jgi:RNA polymerase sigma-70 factor, ECF subfamily